MSKKIEQRTLKAAKFSIREVEGQESRTIEGYAVVFGEKSEVLCDYWQDYSFFREVISPEAITQELLDKSDIKFTMFHDRTKILGRRNRGAANATLTLTIDERGLKVECEMPKTQWGDETLELVRRGDLTGMSFAFSDGQNKGSIEWSKDDDGIPLRTVREIEELFDVTIAADPAYQQTEISAREIESALGVPENIKKQREEDEENARLDKLAAERAERARTLFLLQYGY